MKSKIIEELSPSDALIIIKQLAKEDKNIRNKIDQLAKELFSDIDIDDVADNVLSELDCLYVEDLWDSSGDTSFGYIEPHERANEMIEETIHPYIDEMKKYKNLKMYDEEKLYCMGILKGIYKYDKESKSEFSEWAVDMPAESFGYVLSVWKKHKKIEEFVEMEEFIKVNCPDWV